MYCHKCFSSFVFRGCIGVNIADFLRRPLFPELYMPINFADFGVNFWLQKDRSYSKKIEA